MQAGVDTPRVVITGTGVVSPIGTGNEAFWRSLMQGRSGVSFLDAFPAEHLPSKLVAEVSDFDPLRYLPSRKLLKVMSRDIQLGVAAAHLAITDARLRPGQLPPERVGVVYGAGRISSTPEDLVEATRMTDAGDLGYESTRWGEDGLGRVTPLWLLKRLPNMPACHVSIGLDARGPNNTITCRDASALLAIAEAVRVIQRGAADCMIVGACGSSIHPVDIAKLSLFETLSRRTDEPARACRPFDKDRDGTVLGEGAGALVLERHELARERGVEPYAEIIGTGAGCDARPDEDESAGEGLVHAIRAALDEAGISAGQLGHINAHGKATPREDLVEARALHLALGDQAERIPLTALKSYFGQCDAGGGAVELVGSLLALRQGYVPATLNYETPDEGCRLNVIHGRPLRLENPVALVVNRTDIGQSAAVIVRRL